MYACQLEHHHSIKRTWDVRSSANDGVRPLSRAVLSSIATGPRIFKSGTRVGTGFCCRVRCHWIVAAEIRCNNTVVPTIPKVSGVVHTIANGNCTVTCSICLLENVFC